MRQKEPGIASSVSVTTAALIRLIARFIQTKQPGNSIIERVPQALRRCLRQLVDKLSLNDLLLKPNSGREAVPQPIPAAQTYMNTSLRDIAAHSITSEAKSKMSQACNLLHQEWPSKKVPSLALFFLKNPVNWKHSQILYAWMCTTYQEQKSCLLAGASAVHSACMARNAHMIQ